MHVLQKQTKGTGQISVRHFCIYQQLNIYLHSCALLSRRPRWKSQSRPANSKCSNPSGNHRFRICWDGIRLWILHLQLPCLGVLVDRIRCIDWISYDKIQQHAVLIWIVSAHFCSVNRIHNESDATGGLWQLLGHCAH